MARRKRNNRRRRKGSFAPFYKLLCFALIVGAIVVALSVFFKVERVEVTGNSRYSAEEIVRASGVKQGNNLFLMDKYQVAGRISGALPYVETISINRGLPDTLRVQVRECVCDIALEQDGKTWILCSDGKIVDELPAGKTEGYTVVTGLTVTNPQLGEALTADEENEPIRRQLLEILRQLRDKGMLGGVQEIHLEESSCITIRYLDRLDVEIPWGADFDYKLDFLAAVVEKKLEDYETGTLKMMADGEARLIAG